MKSKAILSEQYDNARHYVRSSGTQLNQVPRSAANAPRALGLLAAAQISR
jgi:hypothetical protein